MIVTAADAAYLKPLAAMLASVLESLSRRHSIVMYVVDGGIADRDRALLSRWTEGRLELRWLRLPDRMFAGLPLWGGMKVSTYHRLLLASLVPEEVGKAIWLDSDLVLLRDLARLWELDPGENVLLAVQDMVVPYVSSRYGIARHRELGISPDAAYFNAGVMLVNLTLWREERVGARAMDYLKQYGRDVFFYDQEGLNAVLFGRWARLDPRWNQIAGVSGRSFFRVMHLTPEEYHAVLDDPWIVHFAGRLKPWLYPYGGKSSDLFFRKLDGTPWAGWRPHRSLRGWFMKVYDAQLRDLLYPAEAWRMRLLQRRSLRHVGV